MVGTLTDESEMGQLGVLKDEQDAQTAFGRTAAARLEAQRKGKQ